MDKQKYLIIPMQRLIATLALIMTAYLTACGHQAENPYGTIVAALGDNDAYAFLEMDYKYNVMVTSNMLYDAGTEKQAAISCDVYYYVGGETKSLGSIMSDGTAYPISFSNDGLFAASGHSIEKYAISEKNGILFLEKGVYVTFDENGSENYTCVCNGEESESTEQEFMEMTEEYASSQAIHFAYGAADCINHIWQYTP